MPVADLLVAALKYGWNLAFFRGWCVSDKREPVSPALFFACAYPCGQNKKSLRQSQVRHRMPVSVGRAGAQVSGPIMMVVPLSKN